MNSALGFSAMASLVINSAIFMSALNMMVSAFGVQSNGANVQLQEPASPAMILVMQRCAVDVSEQTEKALRTFRRSPPPVWKPGRTPYFSCALIEGRSVRQVWISDRQNIRFKSDYFSYFVDVPWMPLEASGYR